LIENRRGPGPSAPRALIRVHAADWLLVGTRRTRPCLKRVSRAATRRFGAGSRAPDAAARQRSLSPVARRSRPERFGDTSIARLVAGRRLQSTRAMAPARSCFHFRTRLTPELPAVTLCAVSRSAAGLRCSPGARWSRSWRISAHSSNADESPAFGLPRYYCIADWNSQRRAMRQLLPVVRSSTRVERHSRVRLSENPESSSITSSTSCATESPGKRAYRRWRAYRSDSSGCS
jgi:hypothetical protein